MERFLSNALEPPGVPAISNAVSTLKLINVLDRDEHLTLLGRKIVDLSIHPRLSVCLVTSAMTGCFNEMVSLAAMLSENRSPFLTTNDGRNMARFLKKELSANRSGDYYALYSIVQMFEYLERDVDEVNEHKFFKEYYEFIDFDALQWAMNLKEMFTQNLADNGIKEGTELIEPSDANSMFNLSLISGLYPNVLKNVKDGAVGTELIEVMNGQSATCSSESTLSSSSQRAEAFTSIYFDSFYSQARRKLIITNANPIPSIYILFVCKNLRIINEDSSTISFILDDCKYLIFKMDKQDLELILKWKDILNVYQQWYLCGDKNDHISSTFKEFRRITSNMLDWYTKREAEGQIVEII